ncbi:MAG: tripartite tricarboxylate transporter substrate binding protein [Angelakisella sp.]|nr:tripartite tricarboxylate transporter substrate binding protein [Angelakisella sp.]
MKKSTKILALAMALLMTVSMAACGGSNNATSANSSEAPVSSEAGSSEAPKVDFPTKPVQIICPVKAGGDTDRNTRTIAQIMSKYLGVNVVVTNVDGGATVMGMQQVLDSDPDGYTMIINGCDMFVPYMMGTTDINIDSFKTVGVPIIDNTTVLAVNKKSGYADLKDLVEKTKAAPGTIEYGGKIGATNQICGVAMNEEWEAGFKFVDVGNNAAKMTALLAEQTDVINISYSLALDYFKTGEFQALCLLGDNKNELLADVPMAADFGLKNVDFSKFFWLGVNPDTPDEIVDILAEALKKTTEDADFIANMESNYLTTVWYAKEDAKALCNDYYTRTMEPYKEAFLAQQ